MDKLVLVIHSLAALVIIGLVLLQQGKGAAMGASFGGGASQTVFGSEGSGNFFTKATWIVAFVFFCTSFGLAIIAKNDSRASLEFSVPAAIQQESSSVNAVEGEVPVAPAQPTESDVPAQ
ncbi:MAG: preprotein translocase subunit SecG [Cellvibrio sp.]